MAMEETSPFGQMTKIWLDARGVSCPFPMDKIDTCFYAISCFHDGAIEILLILCWERHRACNA